MNPYYHCIARESVDPGDYWLLDVEYAWSNSSRGATSQGCPVENCDVTSTDRDNLKTELLVSGYGYGATAITVKLSLVVLFLPSILVFVYDVTVFLQGASPTALDTPAELITLALQSGHPKHLVNTSLGIETMATLRAPVGIRVNSEQSLELVFRDDSEQQGRVLTNVEANKEH